MSAEWKDYIELKNERPELFAEGRQFQIILDEKTVRDYCDKSGRKIGLLYRSPYTMLLVDLVTDPEGNVSMDPEWNVNGSFDAIEGITSEDGRIFGKMAHVERRGRSVAVNIYGEQDMKVFASGVKYFT